MARKGLLHPHYVLQMLQSARWQHKEGEMLRNLDLLGVTWSVIPVPKATFWSPLGFTLQCRPIQNGFLSAILTRVTFKCLFYLSRRESGFHQCLWLQINMKIALLLRTYIFSMENYTSHPSLFFFWKQS